MQVELIGENLFFIEMFCPGFHKRQTDFKACITAGAQYQERDCKVHPAIGTVTKVSIFGSRFPAKSSYHDDCHKSEKYGGQTIGTVRISVLLRSKTT